MNNQEKTENTFRTRVQQQQIMHKRWQCNKMHKKSAIKAF